MRDLELRRQSLHWLVFSGLLAALLAAPAPARCSPRLLFTFGQSRPNTPTTFGWITGMAVDSVSGDIFVPGPQIRRFDANGNFLLGFGSCPDCRGIEVDLATHDIYAAEGSSARVLQYTRDGQAVRQWGSPGTGNGQFASVFDVAVDADQGQVFVIDGTRVQVFDRAGNFLRAWGSVGTSPGQFSGLPGPYGIAFDPATRTVWTSDAPYDWIQAFDEFGTLLRGWDDGGGGRAQGEMRWVRNIDVDAAGNVYECDSDNERVQIFDPLGAFVDEFRGPHDLQNGPFHPRAIAVNRITGEKWVAAAYANRVDKFGADNDHRFSIGNRERDGPIFYTPLSLTVSQVTGDVFVHDTSHFLIKRFTATGEFLNQWGGPRPLDIYADGTFGFDAALLFDRRLIPLATDWIGMPWVAGTGNHYRGDPHLWVLRRFGPFGELLQGFKPDRTPGQDYQENAAGLAVDSASGGFYVSDTLIDRVRFHGADGRLISSIPVPGSSGLALRGDTLYVVAAGSQTVRKYDRSGTLLDEWGDPGQFAFAKGSGIALDSVGNVYVADTGHHSVQVLGPDGSFIESFGSYGKAPGQFRSPFGVAVHEATDTLYVVDSLNDRVQAFALETSPECFDGIDNDGDQLADFPADPGCTLHGHSESPACNDGIDNDGDGGIDFDGDPPDVHCRAGWTASELEAPACGFGFEVSLLLAPLEPLLRRRASGRLGPTFDTTP
jgi:DNA-binding beta-propeller fold protein YncE